jgi:hypothetical protein
MRRLPFGVGKYLIDSEIGLNCKTGALQVVLHQAGDIRIIFQHKNRLTQFVDLGRTRNMINVRLAQSGSEICERTMNRAVEAGTWSTHVYS